MLCRDARRHLSWVCVLVVRSRFISGVRPWRTGSSGQETSLEKRTTRPIMPSASLLVRGIGVQQEVHPLGKEHAKKCRGSKSIPDGNPAGGHNLRPGLSPWIPVYWRAAMCNDGVDASNCSWKTRQCHAAFLQRNCLWVCRPLCDHIKTLYSKNTLNFSSFDRNKNSQRLYFFVWHLNAAENIKQL